MSFHSPTANSGKSSKDPMFDEFTYCLRCGRPETSADITFDEMKICTACRSSEQKMHINWAEREKKLREVLARYKERANGGYDCIIPISGGKDSVFQLYLLTKVYGMNPLTVTFSHNWFAETGRRNLTNALNRLGLDHMEFTPNRQLVNRLARESLHQIGDSCWHCHMGVEAFPLHIATKFKIPLLIYGESVADASGKATYLDNPEFGIDYFLKFSAKVSAAQMACENINAAELQSFVPPSAEEIEKAGIVRIFLGDFIFWDGERQTEFVRDYLGWQEHDVEGTFKRYKSVECIMPGVHDYTKFLKRGFGRGTDFAVGDVRAGLGTREEGFKLSKSYDPVRPKILDYYLKVADYSENEFEQIIASKRQGAAAKFMDGPAVLKQDAEHPVNESVLTAVKTVDEELAIVEQINSITNERLWPGLGTFDQRLEKHREEFESAPGLIRGEVEHPYLLTATQSLDLLAKRKMSTVELARSYADRIADLEPKLHAWAAHDREWMLIQSWLVHKERSLRQPRSSLAGIPIGIKDIFNTAEYPTQMGSASWQNFHAGNDARVVFQLRSESAIIVGKTVTAEFGIHAPGPTLNPYDKKRTPGTSSSGSAAAVAGRMVPLALGTQTAGSTIRPASYCGVFGFKPSFGTVARTGVLKTADTLDTVSGFGLCVDDLRLLFEAIRVKGPNYPFVHKLLENPAHQAIPQRPWKVGLVKTHTWAQAEPYVQEGVISLCRQMADLGIQVEEVELPDIFKDAHEIHSVLYDKSVAYYFDDEYENKHELLGQSTREMIRRGRLRTTDEYEEAMREQSQIEEVTNDLLDEFDILISHATAHAALPGLEPEEREDPCLIWTLAGNPVTCLPIGRSPDNLPFGVQVVSQKYRDFRLLDFCKHLELNEICPSIAPIPDL